MLRNVTRFCKTGFPKRSIGENSKLQFSNYTRRIPTFSKSLIIGGSIAAFGGAYLLLDRNKLTEAFNLTCAYCASVVRSQDSVYSSTKNHALYLTIHLQPDAPVKEIVKKICNLKKFVDIILPIDIRNDETEILAGIGFGPNFMMKASPSKSLPGNYAYHERKGQHGVMPSTGGDIFIHAKSDELSKLYELADMIIKEFPEHSVDKFEDIYGWVYRYGRDLSGFIDGTENPADEEHRRKVAVDENTGGSFVITQKWIHRHNIINREKDETLESWIGRKRSDSTELKRKSVTSHVARMTGGPNFAQKKKYEIVRQSQPFGTVSGENGLFFIGYSSTVEALDYMLNRMVGATEDGLSDDVMRLTKCVKSTYWYFPGKKELEEMIRSA